MQIHLASFKNFLEHNLFKTDIHYLKNINRGGSSINFVCNVKSEKFIVKAIKKDYFERAQRLCDILNSLKSEPLIYTAYAKDFDGKFIFEYENWLILVIEYIDGCNINNNQLNTEIIDKICLSYKHFKNLKINALAQKDSNKIYLETKDKLNELLSNNKSFIKCKILQSMYRLNEKLKSEILLKQEPQIIHGDASLNNLLKDKNNQIAILDFELVRLGYPIEDWAEFLISSLFQNQIFFFSTKKLKHLVCHLNTLFNFTRQDWQYGINLYFLNLLNKRSKARKLFKSIRKAYLFTFNHRKLDAINKMLDSIY